MNEKAKKILKILLLVVVTFVILEALLISALEVLYTLSEYKLEISTELILDNLKNTFTNLRAYIETNWEEKNPFFIIGSIVILLYSLYANKGSLTKKDGWETEDKNAYHGSARWARLSEIFDNQNFLKKSKATIQTEFSKSLKKKVD